MDNKNKQLQIEVKHELDNITLSVIAYQAQKISKAISDSYSSTNIEEQKNILHDGFKTSLQTMKNGEAFSLDKAEDIANRYTPISVLDKEGAGHILLMDKTNPNKLYVAMRGSEELITDWLRADTGNIAIGEIPLNQFLHHLNDLSIHVTAQGQQAPQFGYRLEQDVTGSYFPHLIQKQPAIGDGLAYGRELNFSGHSESSPYAAMMSDIFDGYSTSLNGPGVSAMAMRDIVNEARAGFNKPPIQELGHHHTVYHTTGLSIIDGYWEGLQGQTIMLATHRGSHSSIDAMHAREAALEILQNNPKIQDRNTLEQLTQEYVLNPTRGEQILKAFNEHPSATPETATELVDLERGRKFISIGGTPAGEQWYQDALGRMQEADQQMNRQQTLSQQMQREMSRPNINQQIHKPQPEHSVRRHEATQEPHPQPAHSTKQSVQRTHRIQSVKQQPEYVDLSTIHTLPTSAVPVTIPNSHGHGISQPSHQPNATPTHKPAEEKSLPYKAIDWWLDLNGIKHSDASDQMSPKQLPPHIAKLHQQATDKLGEQLNHLPADQRETAIAMMTHRAIDNKAQEIDYVYINNQGQILMSFDRDRGFDYRMNLSQVAQNNAADMLQQMVALQASFDMVQQQRMMQEQNQSQGMTMAHMAA